MKRNVVALLFLVGCSASNPAPSVLDDPPKVDESFVVPAVQSPDEAVRDTSVVDAPASSRAASACGSPSEPAIEHFTYTEADSPYPCLAKRPPLIVMRFHADKQCYSTGIAGCSPDPLPDDTQIGCAMRNDGSVYVGPSSIAGQLLGSHWGSCTPEEQAMASGEVERPMCPRRSGTTP